MVVRQPRRAGVEIHMRAGVPGDALHAAGLADHVAAAQRPVAAAGAVACLQDQRRVAGLAQLPGQHHAGDAGADDDDPPPLAGRQRRRAGIGLRDRQQPHRRHGAGRPPRRRRALPTRWIRLAARQGHDGRRARSAAASVPSSSTSSAPPIGTPCADAGHRDAERLQPVGQPVRGGGAIHRGAQREDHLGHAALLDARQQRGDVQVLRPDAGQRRQRAAQHVIQAVDTPRRAPAPTGRRRPRRRRSASGRAADRCRSSTGRGCRDCRTARHGFTARAASASAAASGSMRASGCCSIFSAARRALRGPMPGSFASRPIRCSISGPPISRSPPSVVGDGRQHAAH